MSKTVLTNIASCKVASLKAVPALANVIVSCDDSACDFLNMVLGLREVCPDALCSSRVAFRVSAGRICDPTIMLCALPPNHCTTFVQCP
jgi:hypothetical protein